MCHIKRTNVRKSIYFTMVRPHLSYATQVWAPQSIYLILNLEKIQRQATRYILKLPFSCCQSYEQQLKTLSLLPISYWHEYLDMLLFFKITHSLVDIKPYNCSYCLFCKTHMIVCQYSSYQILCTEMQDFNLSMVIYGMGNKNLEHTVRWVWPKYEQCKWLQTCFDVLLFNCTPRDLWHWQSQDL